MSKVAPNDPKQRLEALVGHWRTQGRTLELPGVPAATIEAVDTYEWLPGQAVLLHVVDAWVGDEQVEGAEIIGWDRTSGTYVTHYFGTDGPNSYEASLTEEDGALVWRMRSAGDRFSGRFSADGDRITGHWELLDEGRWWPWMDVTLTRLEQPARRRRDA